MMIAGRGDTHTRARALDRPTNRSGTDRQSIPFHAHTTIPHAHITTTRRSLPKVQGFVQVPSLFYAGSHGFDIWGPTLEDSMRYQVSQPCLVLATMGG